MGLESDLDCSVQWINIIIRQKRVPSSPFLPSDDDSPIWGYGTTWSGESQDCFCFKISFGAKKCLRGHPPVWNSKNQSVRTALLTSIQLPVDVCKVSFRVGLVEEFIHARPQQQSSFVESKSCLSKSDTSTRVRVCFHFPNLGPWLKK